jgi:hypothetical protein
MLRAVPGVPVTLIAAHRAWLDVPLNVVRVTLPAVTSIVVVAAIACSISVPRLVFVVVPQVLFWSPIPISSIPNNDEYVLAIVCPLFLVILH